MRGILHNIRIFDDTSYVFSSTYERYSRYWIPESKLSYAGSNGQHDSTVSSVERHIEFIKSEILLVLFGAV